MSLTLTIGRSTLKICHKAGSRTTVWGVSADDDEATLIGTLKDVIAFVEGEQAPETTVPAETDHGLIPAPPGNGWAGLTPELPDRLKGEVEMIKEGE